MDLFLATSNKGKIIEISDALESLPIIIRTLDDFPPLPSPEETGSSHKDNALLKAHYYFAHSNFPTLADDSGLTVEALGDEMGLYTRRWGAGPDASDQEWVEHFLHRMKSEPNKRAHFTCILAFIDQDNQTYIFEGKCSGMVTDGLEADYLPGLPISACFIPDGQTKVFSALEIEQKNSTSHRGRAALAFKTFIRSKI
ncbi:hypothetical protein HYZ98_00650 [Candidatus Peregrinibacteria bacterium]|nr:hypothetical protein [Candidatus Peregrinibacteria bacterium]